MALFVTRAPLSILFALAFVLFGASTASAQSLEQRIANLERRVAALEAKVGNSSAAAPATASVPTRSTSAAVASGHSPLQAKLVVKKIVGTGSTEQPKDFEFHIQFKNSGGRDVTAFDGDIVLKNLSAKELMRFGFSTAKYIAAGDSALWAGRIEYETDEAGHKVIADSDKSYLVLDVQYDNVTFSDGTQIKIK